VIGWIGLLLITGSSAGGPAYCSHPFEAVCQPERHPDRPAEKIRKRVFKSLETEIKQAGLFEKISAEIPASLAAFSEAAKKSDFGKMDEARKRIDAAKATYAKILNRSEDLILDEFKKIGISEADLQNRIQAIQSDLADQVAANPSFKEKIGGVGATELANTVQSAGLITPRNFRPPNPPGDVLDFYRSCGIDGLEVQAYYSDSDHAFRMCPGYLLKALDSGSVDGFTFVVGHELGHSIGVERSVFGRPNDRKKPSVMATRYQPFLDCVAKNNPDAFVSIADSLKYLSETGVPALEKYLAKLEAKKKPDLNLILKVKRRIETGKQTITQMADTKKEMDRVFPPEASAVQCHAEELCADVLGDTELEKVFEKKPKNPWRVFAAQFKPMCGSEFDPLTAMKYGKKIDDGQHPQVRYRIEAAMRNPKIRAALGCRPLDRPTDNPYCSLSGEVRPEANSGSMQKQSRSKSLSVDPAK
jgi:hypothetical protein